MDWFLYNNAHPQERVKNQSGLNDLKINSFNKLFTENLNRYKFLNSKH